jgi:hypothetical protein
MCLVPGLAFVGRNPFTYCSIVRPLFSLVRPLFSLVRPLFSRIPLAHSGFLLSLDILKPLFTQLLSQSDYFSTLPSNTK